ncbi:E3 ubiquitin-protein ligase TRIM71-like [Anneissia japonica]|uniref:E3 ubiquitin-protein ligase TRIM71-like n=1 Tax=Anneissia japonica TaxID=1529436 RepID=UPI001425AB50|nr:E3 ubiquitin-protein ligase TRIM71-like [Anneissia japonica]XP_033116451.1 E3 ubiquitin-protein ligase TRIM71-like [Anneissia japonica]
MAESNLCQFFEDLEGKFLECAICSRRLQQPTTLPCLHAFCLVCLQNVFKQKEELACPTCFQTYRIPEEELQNLPPNTFIINLLKSGIQVEKEGKVRCVCGKNNANFHCQDCVKYFCCSCKEQHEIFPQLTYHIIRPSDDTNNSVTCLELSLNDRVCSLHKNKVLECYCQVCKTPICTSCAITDHKEHQFIDISDAFKIFMKTTVHAKRDLEEFRTSVKSSWEKVQQNAIQLEKNNVKCKTDINTFAAEMKNMINEMEKRLLKDLDVLYTKKKKTNSSQIDKLTAILSDMNIKWNFMSQLLTSEKPTVLLSSHEAVMALQEKMMELAKNIDPKENGELHFIQENEFLKNIGRIVEHPIADTKFTIDSLTVTQGQTFDVKLNKGAKIDDIASNITATLTQVIEETSTISPKVEQQSNGECIITAMCSSPGVWKLDVTLNEEPIKGSPLIINVERRSLEDTIEINKMVTDIAIFEDRYLLICFLSSQMLKIEQSTNVKSIINISQNASVHRVYQLKTSGHIVFSDTANKCIHICKPDGNMIKSIGKNLMMYPCGLDVNESTNTVYVADFLKDCIFTVNLVNDQQISIIGVKGSENGQFSSPKDVTITKEGNLIVADTWNHRIQMFDSEGSFIKVLVQQGNEDGNVIFPCAVLVDHDENIIVASEHKLQLFTKMGEFVKRIDRQNDGVKNPQGLCMASQNPRRVAVTNLGYENVKIFNY